MKKLIAIAALAVALFTAVAEVQAQTVLPPTGERQFAYQFDGVTYTNTCVEWYYQNPVGYFVQKSSFSGDTNIDLFTYEFDTPGKLPEGYSHCFSETFWPNYIVWIEDITPTPAPAPDKDKKLKKRYLRQPPILYP